MRKIIYVFLLCFCLYFLNFQVIDVHASNSTSFILPFTTITNGIVLDTDQNGKADHLYQKTTSGQDVIFTKILGTGGISGTITMPTSHTASVITVDKDIIYLGSGLVSGSTCTMTLGSYNVTNDDDNSAILTVFNNFTSGTPLVKFALGFTGVSDEAVIHTLCGQTIDMPITYIVKNATNTILHKSDARNLPQTQETNPSGITFSSNGTKMYMIGYANDKIHQYTLSVPFDVTSAVYDNINFNINSQENTPTSLQFSTNGTRMYIIGTTNDSIYQYNLTNPYQIDTASYSTNSFLVSGQGGNPQEMIFSTNGTKMYFNDSGNNRVYQYTLNSPFNIISAIYDNVSYNYGAQPFCETNNLALFFKPDGTKMYTNDDLDEVICEFTLSNPYQVSSATYSSSKTISNIGTNVNSLFIDPDSDVLIGVDNTAPDNFGSYFFGTDWTVSSLVFTGGNQTFGYNGIMSSANVGAPQQPERTVDTNNNIFVKQFSTTTTTGLCATSGCFVNSSGIISKITPHSNRMSIGAIVSPSIDLILAGLSISSSDVVDNNEILPDKQTLWLSYLPTLTTNIEKILLLLQYKLLDDTLTAEPYRFLYDDGTSKYLMFIDGTTIRYTPITSNLLSDRQFGYYIPDATPDTFDTSSSSSTLPNQSFDLVTPLSRYTLSTAGLFSIISGYSLETSSTVNRNIDPNVNNDTAIVPYTVGSTAGQSALSLVVRNSPTNSAISIKSDTNTLSSLFYVWSEDNLLGDNTFDLDLPPNLCVNVYLKDLTNDSLNWSLLGNICNSGTMPKTLIYSQNLSLTFWSLPYGVTHTFDQATTGLTTKVRHDTVPYTYTVKIFDSSNVLQYDNLFTETTTTIDTQLINATNSTLPSIMRVYDADGNQIYYASIGSPSYLSASVAWFAEWFTISGFNLLFMLPIVFGAMFTRNTVGIGTMSTVVLIATLSWFGIIPIPDIAIYLMIFIAVIGVIAYKKIYD